MNGPEFTAIHVHDVTGRSVSRDAPGPELVRASVFRILEGNVLCSIATVTHEGYPHINTAYFSYSDDLDIYFLSHPGSLHCRNLAGNSSMAIAVFSSAQQWTEPGQGVQLFGTCEVARGLLNDDAERSYANRFRAYASWKGTLKRDDLAREYLLYVFRLTGVKILDERTFGDALFVRASVERRPAA